MADQKLNESIDLILRRARGRLARLQLWRAFGIASLIATFFLVLILTGVLQNLPTYLVAGINLSFLAATMAFIVQGFLQYQKPSNDEVVQYADRSHSTRPITTLRDRPTYAKSADGSVWKEHKQRVAALLPKLKLPSLSQEWRKVDRLGLRYMIPVAIVFAAVFAGSSAIPRLKQTITTDYAALFGGDMIQITAWITPPSYTGKAPIFLEADDGTVTIPAGSELSVRTISKGAPKLVLRSQDGTIRQKLEKSPDGAYELKTVLTEPVEMRVSFWGERGEWALNVTPDFSPIVAFTSAPELDENDSTSFSWSATDEYGLATLELELARADPHPAAPTETTRTVITLPDIAPTEASDVTMLDLTRHKWAGLEVVATLVATDGAGQTGRSAPHRFLLPEKLLLQPLARAAQEVRVEILREPRAYENEPDDEMAPIQVGYHNRLLAAPDAVKRAALMLDALTYKGELYIADQSVYLGLRQARSMLETARTKAEANATDDLLWSVALKAEYGDVASAAEALMAAKKALEDALRRGAGENELKRLMQAFRDAVENYIAAKMLEAMNNGPSQSGDQDLMQELGNMLGGQDLEDMLNVLEDLTETGARDQARQLLSDLSNLLQNLNFQTGQNGQGDGMSGDGESEGSEEEQALRGALDKLSELLAEQRGLNDETLRDGQGQQQGGSEMGGDEDGGDQSGGQPSGSQEGGQQGGQQGEGGEGREGSGLGLGQDGEGRGGGTLAERQDRLREEFEAFADGLGKMDGTAGALTEDQIEAIRRAQRRAGNALRRGDGEIARWSQERAVQQMREAAGELARELDAARNERLGESGRNEQARDPMGREQGMGGNDGDSVRVPDEIERQRARDILDELRRRLGESGEEIEEEYLERLLDRF